MGAGQQDQKVHGAFTLGEAPGRQVFQRRPADPDEVDPAVLVEARVLRGEDGLASALQEPFDLVITGHLPSGLSGLHLVSQLHAVKPGLPIILMTADGSSKAAIDAARAAIEAALNA